MHIIPAEERRCGNGEVGLCVTCVCVCVCEFGGGGGGGGAEKEPEEGERREECLWYIRDSN